MGKMEISFEKIFSENFFEFVTTQLNRLVDKVEIKVFGTIIEIDEKKPIALLETEEGIIKIDTNFDGDETVAIGDVIIIKEACIFFSNGEFILAPKKVKIYKK